MLNLLASFVSFYGIKLSWLTRRSLYTHLLSSIFLQKKSLPFPSLSSSSSSRNTKSRVKSISSGSILSAQTLNRSLGSKTRCLTRRPLRNTADVNKLVSDGIGDYVRVQGVWLSFSDGRFDREESSLCGFAARSVKGEGDGWVAGPELSGGGCARDGACYCSCC